MRAIIILMPQNNISLPQITQNNSEKPMPPTGVVVPDQKNSPVQNDLAQRESTALEPQDGSVKTLISPKKIIAVIVLLVVISVSYFVYFVWLPGVQQDDYVQKISAERTNMVQNFELIKANAPESGGSGFLEISEGIFYDISQTLVSPHAVALEDSTQRLDRIETLRTNASAIRKAREEFRIGTGVKDLDTSLGEYLTSFESGLNKLHSYEAAKKDIFNAIGDEYGREVEKLYGVYSTNTSREEKVIYVSRLSELATSSLGRLRQLGAVPNDLRVFLDQMMATVEDQAATLDEMKKDYDLQSEEGDRLALEKLSKFGERQLERSKKVQQESERIYSESNFAADFKKALEAEDKMDSELEAARTKFLKS